MGLIGFEQKLVILYQWLLQAEMIHTEEIQFIQFILISMTKKLAKGQKYVMIEKWRRPPRRRDDCCLRGDSCCLTTAATVSQREPNVYSGWADARENTNIISWRMCRVRSNILTQLNSVQTQLKSLQEGIVIVIVGLFKYDLWVIYDAQVTFSFMSST